MALQINIVHDNEDLLSLFVRNFEFAYVYVGNELLCITWNCRCCFLTAVEDVFFLLQLYITRNIIAN